MTIADTSSSPPPSSSSSSSAQPTDPGARVRPSRRPRRRRWLTVAAVVVAGLAVGLVAFRMFRPHLYSGAVMQAPEVAPSMDGLVLTDGTPVDLDAWLGDVVVVYFGYTHCPTSARPRWPRWPARWTTSVAMPTGCTWCS